MLMPASALLTTFSISADDLDEAVQAAVDHLREVVDQEKLGGFVAPTMTRESFELIDGEWMRVFRFSSELLPRRG